MKSSLKKKVNHSLYPILTPAHKSPITSRVRDCNHHTLPPEVQSVVRSINRGAFDKLYCTYVIQYSTGVYDIHLDDGSSIVVNVDRSAAGKKTRRIKKKKSRRPR